MGWSYLLVALLEVGLLYRGPFAVPLDRLLYSDYLYFGLLAAHLAAGVVLLLPKRLTAGRPGEAPGAVPSRYLRFPEVLFLVCLVLFLFSYIYALNANMDYVQRFMASGGAVRLALDTRQERLGALAKYAPLLLLNLFWYLLWRLRRGPGGDRVLPGAHGLSRWAAALTLASVALATVSFPSFACRDGLGLLAFVSLVPLFLVCSAVPLGWGVLYGTFYGLLQGMLLNFWLGTYSLVTLQLVCFVLGLYHAVFFLPTLWLRRRLPRLGFLVLPAAWVVFEYLRASGFVGYPWGLWGSSQYDFHTLIQIASLTGVWGVSFIVLLFNSGMAAALESCWSPGPSRAAWRGAGQLLSAAVVLLAALCFGLVSLAHLERPNPAGSPSSARSTRRVRLALVQQNSDPRKTEYEKTFRTLVRLTDEALPARPDLVVWSETAFVPNIRRWSQLDPGQYPLSALVQEFLRYQKSIGTWLLTGNDDYELLHDAAGTEQRLDFNATVLFDPAGRRVATYHKVRLVPFTEYFPWRRQLPNLYKWLIERDVYLWEPGTERLVFQHPAFRFATPICFEDAFPQEVRLFARGGAQVIVNVSNDYWSLTEVEARQHAANALFRAVENRLPLVRATASGLTCHIDYTGRLRASLDCYTEGQLVVDVELRDLPATPYSRWGDWFPLLLCGLLLVLAAFSLVPRLRSSL
jgi:apolipoprotein N-acyltransferase